MKKTLLIFLLGLFITSNSKAQIIKVDKVKDSLLTHLINNIRVFKQFENKELSITIIEVTNPEGSANTTETHEVTSNLYFGVSEMDTYPNQNVFCLKNIFAISDIKQDKSNSEDIVSFNCIDISKNKSQKLHIKLKISLNDISILQ
jgi:hypothetical protein